MRSRLFLCAALAGSCLFGSWSPVAHAADPKAKKAKASDSDDKVINKQMQWEESVMGPDDGKRAELDKIARAQAINKAASEKAAKEKEKADAQAAGRRKRPTPPPRRASEAARSRCRRCPTRIRARARMATPEGRARSRPSSRPRRPPRRRRR